MPLLFYPRLFGNDAAVIGTGGGGTAPATPALSQPVDNGDGTGATTTISGSTAGSTNTVYTAPWAGAGSSFVWTAQPPRTGDGSVSLSLADGFYAARCESVLAGLPSLPSNQPLFQTTGGGAFISVHKALAVHVQTTIQGMLGTSIIGPAADSVRVRKVPNLDDFASLPLPSDKAHALPAIIVCYFDQEEIVPTAGTNVRDQIGYPISVVFQQSTKGENVPSESADDPFLRWREAVERRFTHSYNTVVANGQSYTFHDCWPKPGTIFDYDRSNQGLDVGWMKFSFIIWRPRG